MQHESNPKTPTERGEYDRRRRAKDRQAKEQLKKIRKAWETHKTLTAFLGDAEAHAAFVGTMSVIMGAADE